MSEKIKLTHKYIKDSKITNINEILEIIDNNENVFFNNLLRNSAWLSNQQLSCLFLWLERGCLYSTKQAISKTINKGIYPTNDPADKYINLLIIKNIEKPVGIKFDELPYLKEVHVVKSKNYEINEEYVDSIRKQCLKHKICYMQDYYEVDEIERKESIN